MKEKQTGQQVAIAEQGATVAAWRAGPTEQNATAAGQGAVAMAVSLAGGIFQKARGLLFTKPHGRVMLIIPCHDIHTAGMHYCLDVAFVDTAGCVIKAYRSVSPFRRLRCCGAVAVLERFSSCGSPWFEAGDHIGIIRMGGDSCENMSDMRGGGI